MFFSLFFGGDVAVPLNSRRRRRRPLRVTDLRSASRTLILPSQAATAMGVGFQIRQNRAGIPSAPRPGLSDFPRTGDASRILSLRIRGVP